MTAALTLGQAVTIALGFWVVLVGMFVMAGALSSPQPRSRRWDRSDVVVVVTLVVMAAALYSAGLWAVVNLADWVKP